MRITGVECTVLVAPNCRLDSLNTAQDNVLVQVQTDTGITGIGEVESNPWAIKALIDSPSSNVLSRSLGQMVVGLDPAQPHVIWDRLYKESIVTGRRGAGICAIGAMEASGIFIAAGELLQTRFEFEDLMDRGHVDIVQPDIGRVGGITEAMRVVRMAQDRGKPIVPHCWKSGIGIAATVQVALASGNCPFIEFLPAPVSESSLRRELLLKELPVEDGQIQPPMGPGLGVVLDSSAVARFSEVAEDAVLAKAGRTG